MSQRAGTQDEVEIAIDPTNPDRMFAFSNDDPVGVFAVYSDDGGNSWHIPLIWPLPAACCDPTVSWDEFGNLFISYLTPDPNLDLVVAKSTNGGMEFEHVPTLGINVDRPVITTGPILINEQGNEESSVWVLYKDFDDDDRRLFVQSASVNPLGDVGPFTAHVIPNSTFLNVQDIAVGPNGQVLVTSVFGTKANTQGPAPIYTNLDEDGLGVLHDFATPSYVTDTGVGLLDIIPAQPDRGIFAAAGVVYDRGGSGGGDIPNRPAGRVYLVYTDEEDDEFGEPESDDTDIYVIYSDNDGQNWYSTNSGNPVNDDETNRSQFLPRIALDQTSGVIAVSWYDSRNDIGAPIGSGIPGNRKDTGLTADNDDTQLYAAISLDGGESFETNILVSQGTSDEVEANGPESDIDYGDYTGLAFHDGYFYPAWADNSNCAGATNCNGVTGDSTHNPDGATTFDIYTARVVPEPGQLPALSSGIMALWGLSVLRARNRGLGRRLG